MRSRSLFVLALSCASPAFAAQPPTVTFEAAAAVVSGLPAQGQIAWMSVSRERRDGYSRVVRRDGIAQDQDGNGVVRLELEAGEAIAPRSLWTVVDLGSGELALAAPEGAPVQEVAFPGRGLARGASGRLDRFEALREMVELLWVRPGATPGAWGLTTGDGGEGDQDALDDGGLAAALDAASPIGASPAPPEEPTGRDVLVAVDPRTLEVFALRLPGPPPGP